VRIEPFRVDVDQTVLDDLQGRLARTRLADEPPGAGWDYGTSSSYLRELVHYWQTDFDWRAQEALLNQLPQFHAEVNGARIHFAHLRGDGPRPLPILLVHGWPSGYLEMSKLARLLSDPGAHGGDPADAFDVIVPSLPGFGFSGPPPTRGWGYAKSAEVVHQLVVDGLGYRRYGLHSTGAGAYVNGWIALMNPWAIVGYHTHDPVLMPAPSFDPPASPPTEAELAFLESSRRWATAEGAYAELHRTKPQSIGHALTDSPAGLAAWLVEKHRAWSDCDGDVERRYSKDELLTGFTVYWATATIASSLRAYFERVHSDPKVEAGRALEVPTGVAMPRYLPSFPPRRAPREMVERGHDVRHWDDLPRGGHFASWEEPQLVANSIRTFFRTLR
jgi:pimeloyl-ACP methyl ester carboxylesterase